MSDQPAPSAHPSIRLLPDALPPRTRTRPLNLIARTHTITIPGKPRPPEYAGLDIEHLAIEFADVPVAHRLVAALAGWKLNLFVFYALPDKPPFSSDITLLHLEWHEAGSPPAHTFRLERHTLNECAPLDARRRAHSAHTLHGQPASLVIGDWEPDAFSPEDFAEFGHFDPASWDLTREAITLRWDDDAFTYTAWLHGPGTVSDLVDLVDRIWPRLPGLPASPQRPS